MKDSIRQNKKGIILMILSSVFACIGQLFWKLSGTYGFFFLILGFGFYGLGALIMILAYRYGKLSILQPILSLNYILSIVLAITILKENISLLKYIGVCLIIIGLLFIVGGDNE